MVVESSAAPRLLDALENRPYFQPESIYPSHLSVTTVLNRKFYLTSVYNLLYLLLLLPAETPPASQAQLIFVWR